MTIEFGSSLTLSLDPAPPLAVVGPITDGVEPVVAAPPSDRAFALAEPLLSAAGTGLGAVATRLSKGSGQARGVGTAANLLWSGSGALREVGNRCYSKTLAAANLFTVIAGGTNIPPPFGADSRWGYASAAASALSGGFRLARAVADTDRPPKSRILEAASGVATVVAAGLATAATRMAASNHSAAAALATASPALSFTSDLLQLASVVSSSKRSTNAGSDDTVLQSHDVDQEGTTRAS